MQSATTQTQTLPLQALHHVSVVCSNLQRSLEFYRDVIGCAELERPDALTGRGHWLLLGAIGLHLLEGKPVHRSPVIDPEADHISFQCHSLDAVVRILEKINIPFMSRTLIFSGIPVTQVFFHDPDSNMIEACDCDGVPIKYAS